MQYIPNNLKNFECSTNDLPDYLKEIQRILDAEGTIVTWQRYRVHGNSIAGLKFRDRHFRLVCDRGYVEVYEITEGSERQILPPEEQRLNISPRQVGELLAKAVQ